MKKRMTVMVTAVVLALALIIGASYAWFTDSAALNSWSDSFQAGEFGITAKSTALLTVYGDDEGRIFPQGTVTNNDAVPTIVPVSYDNTVALPAWDGGSIADYAVITINLSDIGLDTVGTRDAVVKLPIADIFGSLGFTLTLDDYAAAVAEVLCNDDECLICHPGAGGDSKTECEEHVDAVAEHPATVVKAKYEDVVNADYDQIKVSVVDGSGAVTDALKDKDGNYYLRVINDMDFEFPEDFNVEILIWIDGVDNWAKNPQVDPIDYSRDNGTNNALQAATFDLSLDSIEVVAVQNRLAAVQGVFGLTSVLELESAGVAADWWANGWE